MIDRLCRSLPGRLLALVALCGTAGQSAASMLVNAGFEPTPGHPATAFVAGGSGAIEGWTTTDNGVEWFSPAAFGYTASPNGGYAVDLAYFTSSAGGIEQTFATTPGASYTVVFDFGTHRTAGRDGTAEITVSADGQSSVYAIATTGSDILWESRSFSFVADDSSATLRFRNTQNANAHFAYIDGVAVPAPAGARSIAAAGLAAAVRRRRA